MIVHIWSWLVAHTLQLVAVGWAVEKLLETIGTVTGNKIVDNLGVALGRLLGHLTAPPSPPK